MSGRRRRRREEGRELGLGSRGEEDVTTGIFDHAGEPGVEAGSEDATCRRRAAKESMETLEAEERMKECGSRGEFGDVDVVAGGGAGNQDQEARAQKCRREHGEEERRHRRGACVIYILDSLRTNHSTLQRGMLHTAAEGPS